MQQGRVDFLYMSEEDMIEAGVLDIAQCIEEMEKVFVLLSKGDYIMGGRDQNSHGMKIGFPDHPDHEGMPKSGPDRRFMAMPAYLGGEYRKTGCKWYGSNIENKEKGLPRSILMMTLNDVDTGAPLAYQSANLLSSIRTGAIPGVGAKYLANPDSSILSVIGAGAIGTTSSLAILAAAKNLKTVKIYDVYEPVAQKLKDKILKEYPKLKVVIVGSMQEALESADIVNLATAGTDNPVIKEEWVKPGALFTMSASGDFDPDFAINRTKLVVDNWKMYEEGANEGAYPYYNPTLGVMGNQLLDWIHEGKMTKDIVVNMGDIITGKAKARNSKEEIIIFALGGQPVYDVAWGTKIYMNALEKGIGTKLNLWEKAYQVK